MQILRQRTQKHKLIFFAAFMLFIMLLYLTGAFRGLSKAGMNDEKDKLILIYTPLWGKKPWWNIPYDYNFTHLNGQLCDERRCQVTYEHNRMKESDAVLFHARDMMSLTPSQVRSLRRDSKQQWIWFNHENPYMTWVDLTGWDDAFNLSITYRADSDIYRPYKDILKYDNKNRMHRPKPGTNFATGKKRQCLYFNSNCVEFRMSLVKELKKHVTVDLYGECAAIVNPELVNACPKNSDRCNQMLKEYKFYLSFENTYCQGLRYRKVLLPWPAERPGANSTQWS